MTTPASDVNGLVRSFTTWTNVVLLVVLAVTLGLVLYPTVTGAVAPAATPAPAYEVGSTIDTPADWHSRAPYTLVLFAQSSCGACQRAQPFLKQLVAEVGNDVPVVLVSPGQDKAAEERFGESIGLTAERIQRAPVGLRARVTPTLVLVDRTGKVLHAWEGVPAGQQAGILKSVHTTTGYTG